VFKAYYELRRCERRNWNPIGNARATTSAVTKLYSNPRCPSTYIAVNAPAAPISPPKTTEAAVTRRLNNLEETPDEMQLITNATIANSGYAT
jgi:hypothetical protein